MGNYSYFTKTTVTRLPSKREAGDDYELYMGINHCTKCNVCDGTGYVVEVRPGVYLPVFGDEQGQGKKIDCCPHCNPHNIMPRHTCVECAKRDDGIIIGEKWTGQRMSWYYGRMIVFNGYLCDQCAQFIEEDSGSLR